MRMICHAASSKIEMAFRQIVILAQLVGAYPPAFNNP
jgi:hypothetical protein